MVERAGSDTVAVGPITNPDALQRKIVGMMQLSELRPLNVVMVDADPPIVRVFHGEQRWLGSIALDDFRRLSAVAILDRMQIPRRAAP